MKLYFLWPHKLLTLTSIHSRTLVVTNYFNQTNFKHFLGGLCSYGLYPTRVNHFYVIVKILLVFHLNSSILFVNLIGNLPI